MKKANRMIVGSALGLAAIAVAIDHTQHRLPAPVAQDDMAVDNENPCSMFFDDSPCAMFFDD